MSKLKKYKLKTKKGAAKRFQKSTAKGKIVRSKQSHGHFLSKMGQKAYKLAGTTYVSDSDFDRIDRMLPGLRAKKKRTRAIRKAVAAAKALATGNNNQQAK